VSNHREVSILSASMLAMLDYADAVKNGDVIDPCAPKLRVLGVDIDIRTHNREAIEAHPMAGRIDMIEGSSIDPDIIDQVKTICEDKRVLISLDSHHTHDHVIAELEAYAPMTSVGSYCVVFDTGIEDFQNESFADRPWGVGNNPKTAVHAFLKNNDDFVIDEQIQHKLLITVAPDGFLKRIK